MFYLYFNSLTFALQENGPFSKSCEVTAFPAAASRDEIEQLRVQAAAAVRSYREARAAAATEAIYQEARRKAINETRFAARMEAFLRAAVAPPADAQGGSTADDVAETGSADNQEADPSNILMCGVKNPIPHRNPLKRRKLE